jgi:adenylate cyclase
LVFALLVGAVAAVYTILEHTWEFEGGLVALERTWLDAKFRMRGRIDAAPKVVIAAGDEKTIDALGRFGSWDRKVFATLIDNLTKAGAGAVAFDIAFVDDAGIGPAGVRELQRFGGEAGPAHAAMQVTLRAAQGQAPSVQTLAALAMQTKELEDTIARISSGDDALAQAVDANRDRVVLGYIANATADSTNPLTYAKVRASLTDAERDSLDIIKMPSYGHDYARTETKLAGAEACAMQARIDPAAKPSDLQRVTTIHGDLLLPRVKGHLADGSEVSLLATASNIGFFSAYPDDDGVLRRLPMVYRVEDGFLPSLSLSAAQIQVGATGVLLQDRYVRDGTARLAMPLENCAFVDVPLDTHGRLLVNYYGPSEPPDASKPLSERGLFPRISIVDIVDGKFDEALVKDRIVLVAVTAMGTFDQRVTPFSPMAPGSEVHAAAMQNILDGTALRRPFQFALYEVIAIFIIALLFGVALPRWHVIVGTIVFICMVAALVVVDAMVLFPSHQLFHVWPLALQLAFTWAGVMVWGYVTTGRDKARLRKEFSTVLAPTVVDQLLRQDPNLSGLGGSERELTVMFSDIRGFTTMSEQLTPAELTQFLNDYLTPMTEVLIQRDGTLDKYMGDAIMAFWGAPIAQADHAARACMTAVDMLEKLEELKAQWRKEGKPEIDIGIGLNSGLMRVGFMGSARMRNYTLLGDNVNLGSRLEGLNKNYGTRIIVGAATFDAAKHVVFGRRLDAVRVKGKHEPVNIYEVLGKGTPSPVMAEVIQQFEAGLDAYRAQRFAEAQQHFQAAAKLRGGDPAAEVYIERCAQFMAEAPPSNWDGVYAFKTK